LGKYHANADFFSRMPIPCTESDFIFPEPAGILYLEQAPEGAPLRAQIIAQATTRDPLLAQLREVIESGVSAKGLPEDMAQIIKRNPGQFTVLAGCVLRGDRVFIPAEKQSEVLKQLHKYHQGIVKTKLIARSYVWWPSIDNDIEQMVANCGVCQSTRRNPPQVPTSQWPMTEKPWTRLHIDYAGPVHGKTFLILIDSHSKWVEVAETGGSLTASTTIKHLKKWFAAQGLPAVLVSDNAACFLSLEFQTFLSKNLIKHTTSAPVYPATNGQAERTVQTVKNMLQKLPVNEWEEKLPDLLLTLRTTPTSDGRSPSEILNGRKLITLMDKMHPRYEAGLKPKLTKDANQPENLPPSRTFTTGDRVLYRNYGLGGKWKTGVVAEVLGSRYFYITTNCGKYQVRRHLNQMLKIKSHSVVFPLQEVPLATDANLLDNHQDYMIWNHPWKKFKPQSHHKYHQ
jgi:transposase InsO family protein